jgi:hypothetical protein
MFGRTYLPVYSPMSFSTGIGNLDSLKIAASPLSGTAINLAIARVAAHEFGHWALFDFQESTGRDLMNSLVNQEFVLQPGNNSLFSFSQSQIQQILRNCHARRGGGGAGGRGGSGQGITVPALWFYGGNSESGTIAFIMREAFTMPAPRRK